MKNKQIILDKDIRQVVLSAQKNKKEEKEKKKLKKNNKI